MTTFNFPRPDVTTNQRSLLQGILAPGIAYVGIALLASVVVVICAMNSMGRIGKPFPGFFVWENLFVPAVGETSWTGAASGLRYHSWVRSVDGQAVRGAAEFNALLEGRAVDESIEYTLEKDGQRYTIHAPLMQMDARAWISVLGIYLLNALALLILGLVVLYMKPGSKDAEALFLFCVVLSLYIATATDVFGPYHFRVPYFFFVNLQPAGICYMLSHFPLSRQRHPEEKWLIRLTILGGLTLGAASNYAFHGHPELLIALDRVTHSLMAAFAAGGIAFFGWHFLRTHDLLVRQRAKVVALGTAGAFILPAVMLTLVYMRGLSFPLNFLTVFFVLFPLSIGYAIAKHDLFHIDRVIKRAVVYFVLSGLVFGIYTISISTFDYFFENMTATASRVAEGALILALILLTNPSRARIQDIVDRLYDRRRYSYRDVVRSTSRAFTTILDFEQLVRTAVSLIDETLQPEFVRLYTVDAGGAAILRGELDRGPYPNPLAQVNLSARTDASLEPLTRALREADLVTAGDRAESEDAEAAAQRVLRNQRASLTIPMRLEGQLVGFIIIGSKRAGGPHTADDLELLRTISDQLSLALENAQAYKTVDQLNLNLESKNIELQQANRELQAAQAELVQKERLATIGMLSGAVAHAIRNPLAGIRAAAQLALLDLDDHVAQTTIIDVVSETDRLDDRIGALLTYSKPFEPELKTVSLSEVAARAVRDTKPRAETQKVRVVLEEVTELPPVRVDPDLFEQAIGELISNAIDASPSGTDVVVRTGRDGDGGTESVWLEVQDAGPGIRAEQSEQLFELFYTTKSRGTGFGLATVKKIAEGHGGEVLGYNSEGGGACFRIIVPTRPREAASA